MFNDWSLKKLFLSGDQVQAIEVQYTPAKSAKLGWQKLDTTIKGSGTVAVIWRYLSTDVTNTQDKN